MLDDYFKTSATVARLRQGSVGKHLDAFTDYLAAAGYAWLTTRHYLAGPSHLGRWMDRSGTAVEDLDENVIERFQHHLRGCRCRVYQNRVRCARAGNTLSACRHFLEYLRAAGLARPRHERELPSSLVAFEEWMRHHRGTADRTLSDYRQHVLTLLEAGVRVDQLDARRLREHVLRRSQPRRAQAQIMVRALRMFVRFLIATGRCAAHLDGAIPSVACWRLATLPKYLPAKAIDRVISACPSTALGRRDRAILLLLARLGLRKGDVSRLRFDDLDWSRGRVRVAGKTRDAVWLPLPQEVGDALLDYLKRGRPRSPVDRIFLRAVAPHRELHLSAFGSVTARAIERAGVASPSKGTHIFRHSIATAMLRRGASLDELGALLRHRSRETTLQYAKVDVRRLRRIAQPWPGPTP